VSTPTPGVCSYCHTTDEQIDGNKFCWHDASRTCCSRYACVKAHQAAERTRNAKPKSRFAGWGFGAIIDEMKREQRRAKRTPGRSRGKGKAA
jgi:hypothetical protein